VPYKEAFLPRIKISPIIEKKSTIVIHGRFDSFVKEFYSMIKFLSEHGYQVIAFEGLVQGAARRNYRLAFDLEWGKPVKAVLNYLKLANVTCLFPSRC